MEISALPKAISSPGYATITANAMAAHWILFLKANWEDEVMVQDWEWFLRGCHEVEVLGNTLDVKRKS